MQVNSNGARGRFVRALTIIAATLALFSLIGCSSTAEDEGNPASLPRKNQREVQQVGHMGKASYDETTSSISSEDGLIVFVVAQCERLSFTDALTYWGNLAENPQEEAEDDSHFPEIADATQQADFRCEAPEPAVVDGREGFAVRCTMGPNDSRLACEYRFIAAENGVVDMAYVICPEALWAEQAETIEAVLGSMRTE